MRKRRTLEQRLFAALGVSIERPPVTEHPHRHEWIGRDSIRAPTGPPPEHTKFLLLHCACGAALPFPIDNYRLTTPEWRRDFERAQAARGHHVIADEREP